MSTSAADRVRLLIDWFRAHRRDLPWRRDRDPYRVWVSEVMLQQTRVEAVVPYYERFLQRFPDVAALAAAPLDDVLSAWAGLGYYRRARMLHEAARHVARERDGRLPGDSEALMQLPGIGAYTAAAVASICFDEPRAALDGNAYRVLARMADERRDLSAAAPRKDLQALARSLMAATPAGQRGDLTQALMELGATVCVPRTPKCAACPWADVCAGRSAGTAPRLPVKRPPRAARRVALAVAAVLRRDQVLMRQRPGDASIMPGFWELPAGEDPAAALQGFDAAGLRWALIGKFEHVITDSAFSCRVYLAAGDGDPPPGHRWVPLADLSETAVATISRKALRFLPATGAANEAVERSLRSSVALRRTGR